MTAPIFSAILSVVMAQEITGTTALYCLLGYPAKHSVSPRMHNLAFEALNIDARYLAFTVPPEELSAAVAGLRALGAGGFNLTMPHKNAILPLLDDLSEAARLSGSVNTVVNENGRLIGHTTDGTGYVRSLLAAGFDPAGKQIALLGGGGAAESLLTQLALSNVAGITVLKRNNPTFAETVAFAEKITAHTGTKISVLPIEDTVLVSDTVTHSDLLINATNVGMEPDTERSLIPRELLTPPLFVSDIIYHPRQTKLLRDAKAQGCRTLGGLSMLLFQGVEAFRLWTGQEMPTGLIEKEIFA